MLGEEFLAAAKLADAHDDARRICHRNTTALVARKLAYILAGGGDHGAAKRARAIFLDLEREAFVSLCGERKTQERIAHTLKTGKPLRN